MATPTEELLTVATLSKAQRLKLQSFSRKHEMQATVGVLNAMGTAVIAVRWPAQYWIWHIMRTAFYIPTRYVRFKRMRWELYLLDWCYVVTYISNMCSLLALLRVTTGISTVLVKYNGDLIRAGFAMACGPLAWSVFVFRNSVVFHDVDHSTSVFIHLSPVVLFWCLRWGSGTPSAIEEAWPTMFQVCDTEEEFLAADACFQSLQGMLWCNACAASPSAFVVPPALVYVCLWSVPYFWVVLVWWRDWCQRTGRDTLYTYLCQVHPDFMTSLRQKIQPWTGERYAGEISYMMLHFVTMVVTCSTAYLMWHSFLLNTALMLLILIKAVDNGSSYMFRVFAYRYAQDQLQKHKDKLE